MNKARKQKMELETIGTQTEKCSNKDIGTQTENICVYLTKTQTKFSVNFMNVVVQTDFAENSQINCYIPQETVNTVEIIVQIDLVTNYENVAQTEETPHYVPLVREVVIFKLKNELTMTQHVLAQHQKEVVPLQTHEELLNKFDALTATEGDTFSSIRNEKEKVKKVQN